MVAAQAAFSNRLHFALVLPCFWNLVYYTIEYTKIQQNKNKPVNTMPKFKSPRLAGDSGGSSI